MAARVEVREGAKRKSSLGQLTLSSECTHNGTVSPARNIAVLEYIPRVHHLLICINNNNNSPKKLFLQRPYSALVSGNSPSRPWVPPSSSQRLYAMNYRTELSTHHLSAPPTAAASRIGSPQSDFELGTLARHRTFAVPPTYRNHVWWFL